VSILPREAKALRTILHLAEHYRLKWPHEECGTDDLCSLTVRSLIAQSDMRWRVLSWFHAGKMLVTCFLCCVNCRLNPNIKPKQLSLCMLYLSRDHFNQSCSTNGTVFASGGKIDSLNNRILDLNRIRISKLPVFGFGLDFEIKLMVGFGFEKHKYVHLCRLASCSVMNVCKGKLLS